jgi:hypothetical protein
MHANPLSLYLPSRTKLRCTLWLRGHIHSPYFHPYPYVLCSNKHENKCLGFAVGTTAVAPTTQPAAAGLSCSCGKPAARQVCEIAVLRIRIRDPVLFLPLDPGAGILDG